MYLVIYCQSDVTDSLSSVPMDNIIFLSPFLDTRIVPLRVTKSHRFKLDLEQEITISISEVFWLTTFMQC
jgi:hypothetical protein